MQLPAPDVDRVDPRRALRQADLGEAAGGGADVQHHAALDRAPAIAPARGPASARPRPTQGWAATATSSAVSSSSFRGLRDRASVGGDPARLDGGAGLGAALEKAALDQQDVGALPATVRRWPASSNSFFSSFFRILPLALRGRVSCQKATFTGTLKAASRSATKARSSSSVACAPGFRVHHRGRLLAQRLVRDADQGRVHHGRVVVEDVLDLDAVDVLAAADQHVLGPVDDEEEAFLVDPRQVAGAHPAVDEGLGGGLGLVPVALHHLRALGPQLADRRRRQDGLAVGRIADLQLARPARRGRSCRGGCS